MNKITQSNLNFLDWDFRDISTKEIFPHNICWYPSRYIPQIPAMLINELSQEGDRVLDPFCGSGTTLIESLRLNRSCVGFDINPLATFMTNVKLSMLKSDSPSIDTVLAALDEIVEFKSRIGLNNFLVDDSLPGSNFIELSKWYHPQTLSDLFIIWNVIESRTGDMHDVLKLVFIAILMPCSGLENKKPYTYYADKVMPKGTSIEKDAIQYFTTKIRRLISGIEQERTIHSLDGSGCHSLDVANTDLTTFGKFNLIVTSPPYINVTDYSTGFRLAHLWYSFSTDIVTAKNLELGARWKRKRSDSYSQYMVGMKTVLSNVSNLLIEGGYLCLVLGESEKFQNKVIEPLSDYMINDLGLVHEIAKERFVNQNYFLHPMGGVKKEEILVFRK